MKQSLFSVPSEFLQGSNQFSPLLIAYSLHLYGVTVVACEDLAPLDYTFSSTHSSFCQLKKYHLKCSGHKSTTVTSNHSLFCLLIKYNLKCPWPQWQSTIPNYCLHFGLLRKSRKKIFNSFDLWSERKKKSLVC